MSLLGCRFRISARSFYQVNPVQTKHLYRTAVEFAGLTGKERALDAYCGTGNHRADCGREGEDGAGRGAEQDAVKDAITNAKNNRIKNVRFVCEDVGKFMEKAAAAGEKFDVVFMDPPRSGSSEPFLRALEKLAPERAVYISCNPETLARSRHAEKDVPGRAHTAPLICLPSRIMWRRLFCFPRRNGSKKVRVEF